MAKKSLREKVEKEHGDWVNGVQGLTVSQLEDRLLRYAKYQSELEEFKEKDLELERVSELKKELEAPHKENMKANKMKQKYLIMLIGEKGGNTSGSAS